MASTNEVIEQIAKTEGYSPRAVRPNYQELHGRLPQKPKVKDIEHAPMKYVALALIHLRNSFARVPVMLEDHSRPVDEYVVQGFNPPTITNILVNPQWETSEIIRSIVITGPTGPITLNLGDRTWTMTIPATGLLVISPIAVCLDRTDLRELIPQTPGTYSMELMGHADSRGQLV